MKKVFYSLNDFPNRKSAGTSYIAECPICHKKHLYIHKTKGLYNCFTPGCSFKGILADFCKPDLHPDLKRELAGGTHRRMYAPAAGTTASGDESANGTAEVPMLPTDYGVLSKEVQRKIVPINPDVECKEPLQLAVRTYLRAQGISLDTAIRAGVGCAMHPGTCICYVNRIYGQPVNVKYRSCNELGTGTGVFAKNWSQDSPTTPCPPYNIECINPHLLEEEGVKRLIVVEGEKDVLSLMEAGYRYVISVPNGASSDLNRSFEAFLPWLDAVHEVVVCGDTDLPGRILQKRLCDFFRERALTVQMPGDCKDISDVLTAYGTDGVREVIEGAVPLPVRDIITVSERNSQVLDELHDRYDHGYEVGYGPLTDAVFHPTDIGGAIIVTGEPNAGKTDFLNDLMCRIMCRARRNVCFLSFEQCNKNKHIAHMVRIMVGKQQLKNYPDEMLQPYIDFLDRHMVHLDMQELRPTPDNILRLMEVLMHTRTFHYLVIDPYLFIEQESGKNMTETQGIRNMLTQLQTWGRKHHIWVVIVAHPRKLAKNDGTNEHEEVDMYTIAGSANWANLGDFIFTLKRVKKPDIAYTQLNMLKVRDQDMCHTGIVYYVRQRCGRYDERDSETAIREEIHGRIIGRDQAPFII